uniref:NADH-ubiquinone oxidoreductase chain 6 n=1 Tax=Pleurostomum flabellatum TaxID=405751 RepID=A0A7T0M417_9EUKA|nr:NADH dehydrogenase subunit 6 [Pleurostomum flabellatum]QPL15616.1 NADH dehydrogenase subunit 6 [Pleurostomum flabellatum]
MILIFLYLFTICSSLFTVCVSNPINSVLYLIAVFFYTSIIFLFINVDFLAYLFIMIYVGAIAVLFLFIVMMLNINKIERDHSVYLTIGGVILLFYFFEFFFACFYYELIYIPNLFASNINQFEFFSLSFSDESSRFIIIKLIGYILYKEYFLLTIYSSLLLFVSMVGSVFLTNNKYGFSMRKQDFQLNRDQHLFHTFMY